MGYSAWARAGTALLVAMTPHFSVYAQSAAPSNPATSATIVPVLNPAAQAALQKSISNSQRIEPARDRWRNPAATLQFFGVRPTDTVIEVWPGQGWYTSILGPYLKQGGGSLIVGHFDAAATDSSVVRQMVDAYRARFASDQGTYGTVSVVPFGPRSGALGMPGTADSVLTFRNIHNWMGQNWAEKAFGDFFLVLKPGGILGIEEHRGRTDEPQDPLARDGYVREDFVIQLAREAGFDFIGRSEINANPADTKDHPFGVWTLPPVSRTSPLNKRDDPGFDRTRYDAIGESDRMTLRFRKPLSATGAALAAGTRWAPVIVAPAPPAPPPAPKSPPAVRPAIARPTIVTPSPVTASPVTPPASVPPIATSRPVTPPLVPAPSPAPSPPSGPPVSVALPPNREAVAPRATEPVTKPIQTPSPVVAPPVVAPSVVAPPARAVTAPTTVVPPPAPPPTTSPATVSTTVLPAPIIVPAPIVVAVPSTAPASPPPLPTVPPPIVDSRPLAPITPSSTAPAPSSVSVQPPVVAPVTAPVVSTSAPSAASPQLGPSVAVAPTIVAPAPLAPPVTPIPAPPVQAPQPSPPPAVVKPPVTKPTPTRPPAAAPPRPSSVRQTPPTVAPPTVRPTAKPVDRAVASPPARPATRPAPKAAVARAPAATAVRSAPARPPTRPAATPLPKLKSKASPPAPTRPVPRPAPPPIAKKNVAPPAVDPKKPDWVVPRRRS